MCQYCKIEKGGGVVFGYDVGRQELLSKEDRSNTPDTACKCPCSPWMKEPFLRNMDAIYGRRQIQWRRASTTAMGCHNCHHEVMPHDTPWQEDQLKRLRKKIRNASIVLVIGVVMVLSALAILAWGVQSGQPSKMWFAFVVLMLLGVCVSFGGLDALIFGYKSLEEQLEEMGTGQRT
jgi:hypothetical protein